ncbi:MAG: putative tellurite resistance protein B-like protein [Candidatus Azotimanducaceae bacterium]|jgi:uncharacterized tellurite resistance protein B-like protein|tara:strand:+ start:23832 stop:24272 length:441 start_codon:yes stop_codon:yes gene_type:complete
MLSSLRKLFSREEEIEDGAVLDPALAAAALMFEVVWADHEISQTELDTAKHLLKQMFSVQEDVVMGIVADAEVRLKESVGVHGYTNFLNDAMTEEEKFSVVTALWQIALAEDGIDVMEEHSIRKTSDLLYLSHSRFIEAKLKAKAL